MTLEEAKRMCKPAASNLACAQLVYGAAGQFSVGVVVWHEGMHDY